MKIKPPRKILSKLKQLKSLKGASVVVGFPKGWNAYPDGTPVAMVATVHEFGSPAQNIPSRPFFRTTLFVNKNYKELRIKKFTMIMNGKLPVIMAMNQLGDTIKNDIVDSIIAIKSPKLKDNTIKRKGSSNPLVDTGHLKQSVTYKVI